MEMRALEGRVSSRVGKLQYLLEHGLVEGASDV